MHHKDEYCFMEFIFVYICVHMYIYILYMLHMLYVCVYGT